MSLKETKRDDGPRYMARLLSATAAVLLAMLIMLVVMGKFG